MDWLRTSVEECVKCPLKHRNYVSPRASYAKSPIMFVGEAPGFVEDEKGFVFVGRSGHLLDSWINYLGIKDYYITNTVKHHPGEPSTNETPTSEMIYYCKPYLLTEISTIKPKLLFLMGEVATSALFPINSSSQTKLIMVSLNKEHGLEYDGIPTLISYHPAYFVRRGISIADEEMRTYLDQYKPVMNKVI